VVQLVIDLSSAWCTLAWGVALSAAVRSRHRQATVFVALVGSLALLAAWMVSVALYARDPQSPLLVRATLTALCLVSTPWLTLALGLGDGRLQVTLQRWRALLLPQAAVSVLAGTAMWFVGLDWVTGIGAEPAAVLTRAGSLALAATLLPALTALTLFLVRLPGDVSTMPALLGGIVGVIGCVGWTVLGVLWRGYFSLSPLVSPVAVSSAAAMLWAAGMLQEFVAVRSLAPSRRLVYGAVAVSLVLAYLLAARIALRWVAELASRAIPVLLPVAVFLAGAGLLVGLGSRRTRHRLWVTVGHHLFRSKHDYGEVWIHLTELVSAARDTADFLQRAALFCRDVLCVPDASIWLVQSSGGLGCVAHTGTNGNPRPTDIRAPAASGGQVPNGASPSVYDPGGFAAAIGAAAAFPMQLNRQLLGFIAIDARGYDAGLDDEDRRVMQYIAAQVASAVALYRLGEEIADAREVASFHRLSAFVIHDLKNLVAQQSFVLENAPKFKGNPAFVADALAAFEDSTNRMRGLIARLRSREPRGQPAGASCDLVELIRELVAMPRLSQRAGCAVHVVVPAPGQTCLVGADRSTLAQVFSNLLVNAVESLPGEGGEVTVRVQRYGDGWQVAVQDNGCGMSEAYLRQHLFRPFRTTKDGGLGIGLYQCKTVVEAVGGSISVRSLERQGTTVTVTLPAWLQDGNSTGGARAHGETHSAHR
jgi:signal transduction histidine kinase